MVPSWILARWILSSILVVAHLGIALAWVPPSRPTIRTASTKCSALGGDNNGHEERESAQKGRREILTEWVAGTAMAAAASTSVGLPAFAEGGDQPLPPVEVTPLSPDAKKLFNEGRALESQGNMIAAQRLYGKVVKISPRFIYGWSNLGNTEVALGDLSSADDNYSRAIELCQESSAEAAAQGFGIKKCNDLYVLLLNRGSVRLNTPGRKVEALQDLRQANNLRERPDAVILQNLARAEELNGFYTMADKNYNLAISMTANEVNPFWLRSAMVKLQLGDLQGGRDLLKRVENRFPDAPEVKAASATFLWEMARPQQANPASALLGATSSPSTNNKNPPDDAPAAAKPSPEDYKVDAQRKFLEIPDRQRLRFVDPKYLDDTIAWPPIMKEGVTSIARNVGDYKRVEAAAPVPQ